MPFCKLCSAMQYVANLASRCLNQNAVTFSAQHRNSIAEFEVFVFFIILISGSFMHFDLYVCLFCM